MILQQKGLEELKGPFSTLSSFSSLQQSIWTLKTQSLAVTVWPFAYAFYNIIDYHEESIDEE